MSKLVKNNRLLHLLTQRQSEIALLTTFGMVFGFLCGRAILSASMFLFFLNAVWATQPKDWIKQKWWMWGLAWFALYGVSYFWSTDIPYWQERLESKYAIVIIPIAFALLKPIRAQHIRWLSFGLITLIMGGCIYSLTFYFADPEKILAGYFYSKSFTTPAYNDHIRFSIFVGWMVIWCCFVYPIMLYPWQKIVLLLASVLFVLYLHILAARSGLLVLYSFGALYIIYLFLKKRFIISSSILICGAILLFILYRTVPSFQKKMLYIQYSFVEYKRGNVSADFSDIGRIISYDLAAKIIVEHPILGVGAGDIRQEMKIKYQHFSPNTKPEQHIVPHNQIMEVMLAGGIVTLLVFLKWLSIPIMGIRRNRSGFYIFATWFALLISMMVEPMLEVQFGVFVYLFCMLWILKVVASEKPIPEVASL